MKARLKTSALLLTTFLFSFINLNCSKNLQGDLIIKNVNIIDVKTGDIDSSMDVVIKGESNVDIQKYETYTKYEAEKVIDGTDKYLIPGLWDMHTHTWWGYKDFFPLLIANGVTGIREMFGDIAEVKKIREEIKSGKIVGSIIYQFRVYC